MPSRRAPVRSLPSPACWRPRPLRVAITTPDLGTQHIGKMHGVQFGGHHDIADAYPHGASSAPATRAGFARRLAVTMPTLDARRPSIKSSRTLSKSCSGWSRLDKVSPMVAAGMRPQVGHHLNGRRRAAVTFVRSSIRDLQVPLFDPELLDRLIVKARSMRLLLFW